MVWHHMVNTMVVMAMLPHEVQNVVATLLDTPEFKNTIDILTDVHLDLLVVFCITIFCIIAPRKKSE